MFFDDENVGMGSEDQTPMTDAPAADEAGAETGENHEEAPSTEEHAA